MPFTGSHAAAVLPLRRWHLPLSALVAGSMAPDLTYYVPGVDASDVTHTLVGAATIGALLGVVMFTCWHALFAPLLLDQSPAPLRGRLAAAGLSPLRLSTLTATDWARVWLATALGALTHAAWDSFTHAHGWAAERVPALQQEYLGLPGSAWAQHLSTVIGGMLVVVALVHWYRTTTPLPVPIAEPRIDRSVVAALLVALPAAGAAVAGVWMLATMAPDSQAWRQVIAVATIRGGTVLLAMLLLTGLAHAGAVRHASMGA